MRLITIDNGNTNQTVAIFENSKLLKIIPLADYQQEKDDFVLISSVGKALAITPSFDLHSKRTQDHFFDMPIHYAKTLGDDRMIAAYGVFKKITGQEKVLLIDAGTFITCDFISSEGFLGGYIFPGLDRFLGTYSQSAQLPSYKASNIKKMPVSSLPKTTEEAILGAGEIYLKSILNEMIGAASPDAIVFTGGSAKLISELINLKLPHYLDLHLLHSSLLQIYQDHLTQA